MARLLALLLCVTLVQFPAFAQETEGERENSRIIRFVEDELSSDNQIIRLSGVSGLLASNAMVEQITIADREGVWLTISDASIVWSRLALLEGRVQIDELKAASIEILRPPLPEETTLTPEAQPLRIPDLPLSVEIGQLSVPKLLVGEPVVGVAAELVIEGSLNLVSGGLDTDIRVDRLDGSRGFIALKASYDPQTRLLAVDLDAAEPVGGLVATAINLPGSPAVEMSLAGQGPVDNLDLALLLSTGGVERVIGRATVRPDEDGTAIDARIAGDLTFLTGDDLAILLEGGSEVVARGKILSEGGFAIDAMRLSSGPLYLEGGLTTTADGFLETAALSGRYGGEDAPTPLPGGAGEITGAALTFTYGGTDGQRWSAAIDGSNLSVGELQAGVIRLRADGALGGIQTPGSRSIDANIDAQMSDLSSRTPELRRALGNDITLSARTRWREGSPLMVDTMRVNGADLDVTARGSIEAFAFEGRIAAQADRIARFSDLAGRRLAGDLDLTLEGRLSPLSRSFDLAVDGTSRSLRVGNDIADRLLNGDTRLSGSVLRDETGIQTRNLQLSNDQFRLSSDGVFSTALADFAFDASLSDIDLLGIDGAGRVDARGKAEGQDGVINLTTTLALANGTIMDRPILGASATFTGALESDTIGGALSGRGRLGGEAIDLSGDIDLRADGQSIRGLELSIGRSRFAGDILRDGMGLMAGSVAVTAPDIAPLAALFFTKASGQVNAEFDFDPDASGQRVQSTGFIKDFRFADYFLGGGAWTVRVDNALKVPALSGTLRFNDAVALGVVIDRGSIQADQRPEGGTSFALTTLISGGNRLTAKGSLSETGGGYRVGLEAFDFANGEQLASLARPATLTVSDGDIGIERLAIVAGDGLVTLAGTIADQIELDAAIETFPLDIANSVRPDLGLSGSLSGTTRVSGSRQSPDIVFDMGVAALTTSVIAAAELPAVDAKLAGQSENGQLNLNGSITGPGDFEATVEGSVPIGDGEMALVGRLDRFPLALVDRLAGRQGLVGRVDGTYGVAGPIAEPRVRFSILSSGLSANALANNGIAPVTLTAEGSYRDNRLVLATASAVNADGLDLKASGRVPLTLEGLDLALRGQLPLKAVGFALARAGFRGEGVLNLGLRAAGSLSNPTINGDASLSGATLVIPVLNLRLENLNAEALLTGDQLTVRSAEATNSGGGRVGASGTVRLDAPGGFPADLAVTLRDIRYTDGRMASARLNGDLSIEGPVARDGLLSGRIDVEQLEFRIPEAIASANSYRLDVKHLSLPSTAGRTLERARLINAPTQEEQSEKGLRLGIRFLAPSRVFVRGRGLDAEMGGEISLGGTVRGVKPVGQFDLLRGRFSILGQRIDLTSGAVQFDGDPLPVLALKARTQLDDVEATISVEGRTSAPEIDLSSVPDLPDDEILAQLVFRRALSDLSPLQVARLAAALAELAGRGGIGFFDQVRSATGLDDLDFETSDDGSTVFRAGKYLNENLYSTIEADTRGTSRASIIFDINEDLTARGTVDNDGNTSIGIFFERDY